MDGDGIERTIDTPESTDLLRKVAAESIVLLRNERAVLPINPKNLKKIAIVGPNAKAMVLSGGGSAALKASFYVNPYEGIVKALKDSGAQIEIGYSEGVRGSFSYNHSLIHGIRLNCSLVSFTLQSLQDDAISRLRDVYSGWRTWLDRFLAQAYKR